MKVVEYKDEQVWVTGDVAEPFCQPWDCSPPHFLLCEITMPLLFKTLELAIPLPIQVAREFQGEQQELLAWLGDDEPTNFIK